MDNNTPDFSALAAGGLIGLLLSLLLSAGAIAFSIWITYTIIWRAVRRGMREFHYPSQKQ